MTSSDKIKPAKRDHAAFALLIAMGLSVAVVTGTSLSGIAGGAVQDILRSAGFGQETEIKAEQRQQARKLAQIEASLGRVRGDVAELGARADGLEIASAEQAALLTTALEADRINAAAQAVAPPPGPTATGPSANAVELTELRSSIDEHAARNQQEFSAINKRIDWLETLVYSRDASGAIQPTVTPPRHRSPKSSSRWFILHAQSGVAVIAGRNGTIDVTPGFVVPDLGRVSAVEQRDGRWVVVTDGGTITERLQAKGP